MYNQRILLGATKDGNIAFAGLDFKSVGLSKHYELTVSFDTVRPFCVDDIDEDYVQDYLDGLTKSELYDLCDKYDCAPSCLAQEHLDNNPLDNIVDLSLYPERIEVMGAEMAFESVGCGQQDLLLEMTDYVNFNTFSALYVLWKRYHLKTIQGEDAKFVLQQINKILAVAEKVDEEEWIKSYLIHRNDEGDDGEREYLF